MYKKHEPPFAGSEVWRLKGIGRDGEPRKRLEREEIKTVLDLLFWLCVNPKSLQEVTITVYLHLLDLLSLSNHLTLKFLNIC